MLGPDLLDLGLEGGGDVAGRLVGDDGDALVRLEAQAIADGVARAGDQLGIDGNDGVVGRLGMAASVQHGAKPRPGQRAFKPAPAVASGCGTVRSS